MRIKNHFEQYLTIKGEWITWTDEGTILTQTEVDKFLKQFNLSNKLTVVTF